MKRKRSQPPQASVPEPTSTDFSRGPLQYGQVKLLAVYRCSCGGIAAPAEQPNGNAAVTHSDPRCETFERLNNQEEYIAYFYALEPLPMSAGRELVGNTSALGKGN